jgi:hypothetical protein
MYFLFQNHNLTSSQRTTLIAFSASGECLTLRGCSSPEQVSQLVRGILQAKLAKVRGTVPQPISLITFSANGECSILRGCSSPEQVSQLVWGVLQTKFAKDAGNCVTTHYASSLHSPLLRSSLRLSLLP